MLLVKYQRAILVGEKYDWDLQKCVTEGTAIEAALTAQGVADAEQADKAVEMVIKQIQEARLSTHKQAGMHTNSQCTSKMESVGRL